MFDAWTISPVGRGGLGTTAYEYCHLHQSCNKKCQSGNGCGITFSQSIYSDHVVFAVMFTIVSIITSSPV